MGKKRKKTPSPELMTMLKIRLVIAVAEMITAIAEWLKD